MTDTLGVIIVAAGSGQRMGGHDKLFTDVGGMPLLARAIAAFNDSQLVDRIVLVLSADNIERARELVAAHGLSKVSTVCLGGPRRQDSVRLGLEALGDVTYVAVHDGGRPLVDGGMIARGMEAVRDTGAAIPVVPLVDTVKEVGEGGAVVRTLDRGRLRAVQTPQVFRRDLLLRAHREVTDDVTDDAAMMERIGVTVRGFKGDPRNVKVTTADDLHLVEALLTDAD